MNRFVLLAYVLLALGAGCVAAQTPNFNFDRNADFSKYKTYKWVSLESAQYLDDLTADQLMGTLEAELAKKGLTKSPSDRADLYIRYQIARDDPKHLNHYDIGEDYPPPAGAASGTPGETPTVHSGPLVLYIFDSAKKKLVWWSVSPNPIDADAAPEKKQKHLDRAIAKLLSAYPPPNKP